MMTSKRYNVTLRREVKRLLEPFEIDDNFDELRKAIDDIANLKHSLDDYGEVIGDAISVIEEEMENIIQVCTINSLRIDALEKILADNDLK